MGPVLRRKNDTEKEHIVIIIIIIVIIIIIIIIITWPLCKNDAHKWLVSERYAFQMVR